VMIDLRDVSQVLFNDLYKDLFWARVS